MTDVGESELDFLTYKPVSGELLANKLEHGPLPQRDTVRYAVEIGRILQTAHARGVVHGNLSPSAVVLTEDGARVLRASPPASITPYTAPERIQGRSADPRSDIFAFGAVVYEMATGRRAFEGGAPDRLEAAILGLTPPPIAESLGPRDGGRNPALDLALDAVVEGCLQKDPQRRRQRIQNAVIELKLSAALADRPASVPSQKPQPLEPVQLPPRARWPAAPGHRPAARRPRPAMAAYVEASGAPRPFDFLSHAWLWGAALALVVVGGLGAAFYMTRPQASVNVLRFAVPAPDQTSHPGTPAVSPDGRFLVFSALGPEGKRMLWLRPLDALHATVIEGSEGGFAPFWSPDSAWVAFFAGRALRKVPVKGGAPQTICAAEGITGGGSWGSNGVILFAPALSGGLYQVPAAGGAPQPVTSLDKSKSESSHLWPQFLPGGQRFLFFVMADSAQDTGVYTGTLGAAGHRLLFQSETNAVYSPAAGGRGANDYLLFIRYRNVVAQAFNPSNLEMEGQPFTLMEDVGAVQSMALAPISVSANGMLIYQSVGQPTRQLVWFDRAGKQLGAAAEPGDWGPPRIAPDGKRAVAGRADPATRAADLWVLEADGSMNRLTATPYNEGAPVWSPDGTRVAYFSDQSREYDIYQKGVNGGSPELLLRSAQPKYPNDWSRDGRLLLLGAMGQGTSSDLMLLPLADRRPVPFLGTVNSEGYGAFSPDGRWIAYQSEESGRTEVYVERLQTGLAGAHRRWQVSTDGGGLPRWRADGKELFYMTPGGRVAASAVRLGDETVQTDPPQALFETLPIPKVWNLFDASADGQRFLVNMPLEWSGSAPITVVTNWRGKLK